jgi:short-subunit dehydrogenase
MKIVIVGASGSLGKAIAYSEADPENALVLVASDSRDLEALASDIALRYSCKSVEYLAVDLSEIKKLDMIPSDGNRYYFPVGQTLESDKFSLLKSEVNRLFNINFFCMAGIISNILANTRKTPVDIIGFGSIAETRGRSNNVFYSASKRSLTSMFESLLHDSEKQMIRPYLFQIGYMKSQLTFGKKLLFAPVEATVIADSVRNALYRKKPGIYYLPAFWKWICSVLKLIPWTVYRKMKF